MSDYPRWVKHADQRAVLREVSNGLYVGGMIAVCERPHTQTDWWTVIDCHGYRVEHTREERFPRLPRVLRYGYDDGGPVPHDLLAATVALYDARRGPMLVSCAAGRSRSVSVAYAILRVAEDMEHDEALRCVSLPGDNNGPAPVTIGSAKMWSDARTGAKK